MISIGDLLYALGAKLGLPVTFGLGLSKWENLHIIIQVSLIIVLSVIYVSVSGEPEPAAIECYEVAPVEAEGTQAVKDT